MTRATLGEVQAEERRRLGLPDARERDPLAAQGFRLPWGRPEADLIEILAIRAAVQEMEDLSIGIAIPGAQGACLHCHHARVCHKDARWRCETCTACPKYIRAPRQVTR